MFGLWLLVEKGSEGSEGEGEGGEEEGAFKGDGGGRRRLVGKVWGGMVVVGGGGGAIVDRGRYELGADGARK